MVFLHLSDLHFLRDYTTDSSAFAPVFQAMTSPLEQLDLLMERLPSRPDFLLITGDLVHEGTEADYAALKEGLARRFPGLPLHTLPGNHDQPALWQQAFGHLQSRVEAIQKDGFRLILLDNTWPGTDKGRITHQDVEALRSLLSGGEEPYILAAHHHLIKAQFVLPPADYPDAFPALLRHHPPLAILTGHTHHLYQGHFAGAPVFSTGSLCFRGNSTDDGVMMEEAPAALWCQVIRGQLKVDPVTSPLLPRLLHRMHFVRA